ncbi:MAG: PD-(D/E)XK nuclease family protein [Verrucomicrobiota bacterium]|nr:PD-(D/E)XK nuclease family protein [Verrucomicrobiota bacterium]
MGKLENVFSWSVSRDRLFRRCLKAYYYNYYGSWDGWDKSAPWKTQKIYMLKKMTSLKMWAGSIVHEVIAEALNRYAQTGKTPTAGELQGYARTKLRRGWIESVNKEWQQNAKKINLFELYYGNGKSLLPETTDEIRERVYNALTAFAQSAILKQMLLAPYTAWKPIDQLSFFMLNELKIWAAIDFSYIDDSGTLQIIDWKTGRENTEELKVQLACYALYSMEKWGVQLSKIKLHGVYLNNNASLKTFSFSDSDIIGAKEKILSSSAEMCTLLDNVEGNMASEENFPCCENDRLCKYCNFKELCGR